MNNIDTPLYLARPTDGAVCKRNENGTYSFMDTPMWKPYEYKLDTLLSCDFEIVTEDDFPELKRRGEIYHEWLTWYNRSDGHDGIKGGTFEEFKDLMGY